MRIGRKFLFTVWKSVDLFLMVVAFSLSVWQVYRREKGFSLEGMLSVRLKLANLLLFVLLLALWHLIFTWLGLYRTQRLRDWSSEAWDLLKATSLGSLAILNAASTRAR